MSYRELKLSQARELVKTGEVDAAQIAGLESWPEGSVVTVPVKPKVANQEEAASAVDQPSVDQPSVDHQ